MAITKDKPFIKEEDASTFLSDLNSAIKNRSSSSEEQKTIVNRFVYSIDSASFLLEPDLKVENISPKTINHVPHSEIWYEGIISIRGTIMPVINLSRFMNGKIDLGNSQKTKKHFLLLDHKEHNPVVILIDKLPEVVDIEEYSTLQAPASTPSWHIETLEKDNKKILKLDHKKLLNQLIKY